MKQRITYLLPEGHSIDAKALTVEKSTLTFTQAHDAVVERRTTYSIAGIPGKAKHTTLQSLLKTVHELHIRWSSINNYQHIQPLVSRVPAGLHVFYTPRDGQQSELCSVLQHAFDTGLKCTSVLDSFTRPSVVSERFAAVSSYQFHYLVHDLRHLGEYITTSICPYVAQEELCKAEALMITTATHLELDFDAITQALVLTAIYPPSSTQHSHIDAKHGIVEVGVLTPEPADEPEELKLGGYLTIVGEDVKPKATMFSFPSRHHPLPTKDKMTFQASFELPTGLHPTLSINFEADSLHPPRKTCALHTYLTLPSALFLDRYQLSDAALLASNNLKALRALSGAEDLEAPEWAVQQWGSASLLELAPANGKQLEVKIPLHLRYLQSINDTVPRTRDLAVPQPIVFWACEAEEGLKMSTNPFDRINLGYDGLFGPKTMFYHVPAASGQQLLKLEVPVLDPANATWLPMATLIVVIAGITWTLWSLLGPLPTRKTHSKAE